MAQVLPEAMVVEDWLRRTGGTGAFITARDGPVAVLDPGRRNDDHGADFTNALLANGRTVPTVVLEGPAPAPPPVLPDLARALPCATRRRSPEETAAVLDELGLARFEARVQGFRDAFDRDGPDQALYAGLAAALGYRRNRDPMRQLAASLPLREISRGFAGCRGPAAFLAAAEGLLIGAVGLLPSQRTRRAAGATVSKPIARLEAAWRASGGPPCLEESDWHHARVRPGNYPVRRLAALARLLARYRQGGLAEGLLVGLAAAAHHRDMAALVAVPAAGLWEGYLDFGRPVPGKAPALCGAGRAEDIVVNVLLPFAAAWYDRNGYAAANGAAVAAWRDHPPLADNIVFEEVRRRLALPRPATALRQQGMLRLRRRYCAAGNCRTCPVVP